MYTKWLMYFHESFLAFGFLSSFLLCTSRTGGQDADRLLWRIRMVRWMWWQMRFSISWRLTPPPSNNNNTIDLPGGVLMVISSSWFEKIQQSSGLPSVWVEWTAEYHILPLRHFSLDLKMRGLTFQMRPLNTKMVLRLKMSQTYASRPQMTYFLSDRVFWNESNARQPATMTYFLSMHQTRSGILGKCKFISNLVVRKMSQTYASPATMTHFSSMKCTPAGHNHLFFEPSTT